MGIDWLIHESGLAREKIPTLLATMRTMLDADNPMRVNEKLRAIDDETGEYVKQVMTPEQYFALLDLLGGKAGAPGRANNPNPEGAGADAARRVLEALDKAGLSEEQKKQVGDVLKDPDLNQRQKLQKLGTLLTKEQLESVQKALGR